MIYHCKIFRTPLQYFTNIYIKFRGWISFKEDIRTILDKAVDCR